MVCVCVCMHAHSRENEEKCGEMEKIAQQSSISSPQKGEIKSRLISRCQHPPGGGMGTEQLKGEVREKVHLHLQKPLFLGKQRKKTHSTATVPRTMHEANAQNAGSRRVQYILHI